MYIGTGVIVDVAYRVRTKSYVVEETDSAVREAKDAWEKAKKSLDNWVAHPSMTEADYLRAVKNVNTTYQSFI